MKITATDLQRVGVYGGIALTGGIGYALSSIWLTQKTNIQVLRPTTEILYKDSELLSLFMQLSVFRDIDEMAFFTAVNELDKMLYLHEQFKTIQMKEGDRITAAIHMKAAQQGLNKLIDSANNSKNGRGVAHIDIISGKIYTAMMKYWLSIMKQTEG